jgi:glycolate oxidase FAD binding subunit
MRGYSGVVTYDPSEFLISARAGTSIAELESVLAAQGQYLPFDPVLSQQGATLGGSVASGISGPCRLLYGGLRDFIMEVQLCDSAGREVRGGGKVVKNAAGFDLPKLVVGSYGRMGIITEATLKVFPKPPGNLTLSIACPSLRSALERGLKLLALPLPIAALEIEPGPKLLIRLAGPIDSLAGMAARVTHALPPGVRVERIEHGSQEVRAWHDRAAFDWASDYAALARVAITHHQCSDLEQELKSLGDAVRWVLSCGVSVAWIAVRELEQLAALDAILSQLMLSGVAVRGPSSLTPLGDRRWIASAQRIQQALDPAAKYVSFSQ